MARASENPGRARGFIKCKLRYKEAFLNEKPNKLSDLITKGTFRAIISHMGTICFLKFILRASM